MKKETAFTLAEVLITLGIIGVVAALTIPTLIANHKRTVLKTQFNKAYSTLSQVIEQWRYDLGGDLWSEYDADRNNTRLRNDFYSYLKGENTDQNAEIKPYYTSAWHSTQTIHKCPAGCCEEPAKYSYKAVDGVMYLACFGSVEINFAFDINGNNKGPNKWGVDLFDFDLYSNNKLIAHYDSYYCNTYRGVRITNVNDGMGCTYYAVSDPDYFKKIDF